MGSPLDKAEMPDLDRMPPEPPADAYYECRRVRDARSAKEPPRLSVWSRSERGAEAAEVRVDAVRRLLQAGGLGDVVVLADRGGRAEAAAERRRIEVADDGQDHHAEHDEEDHQ